MDNNNTKVQKAGQQQPLIERFPSYTVTRWHNFPEFFTVSPTPIHDRYYTDLLLQIS